MDSSETQPPLKRLQICLQPDPRQEFQAVFPAVCSALLPGQPTLTSGSTCPKPNYHLLKKFEVPLSLPHFCGWCHSLFLLPWSETYIITTLHHVHFQVSYQVHQSSLYSISHIIPSFNSYSQNSNATSFHHMPPLPLPCNLSQLPSEGQKILLSKICSSHHHSWALMLPMTPPSGEQDHPFLFTHCTKPLHTHSQLECFLQFNSGTSI